MKNVRTTAIAGSVTTLALFAASALAGAPADSVMTYQGFLKDSGDNVNGAVNMAFNLFNAEVGGAQEGPTINQQVDVVDGLFSVALDFGEFAFTLDNPLWLQISVEGTDLPRQPLTSVPHSMSTRGLHVNTNGDLGIGTTSPDGSLHISRFGNPALVMQNTGGTGGPRSVVWNFRHSNGDGARIQAGRESGNDNGMSLRFQTEEIGGSIEERMRIDHDGKVGIGTTAPTETLDVAGTVKATSFSGDGSALTNLPASSVWNENGSDLYYDGDVGIGTTSPLGRLHVSREANPNVYLENTGNTNLERQVDINFNHANGTGARIRARREPGQSDRMRLQFWTETTGGVLEERMRIEHDGNVGIGTTTPTRPLDVRGTSSYPINVTSTNNAGILMNTDGTGSSWAVYHRSDDAFTIRDSSSARTRMTIDGGNGYIAIGDHTPATMLDVDGAVTIRGGADIVEGFDASCGTAYEPGTVVVIDPANPGKLMCSDSAYDYKVAGVVSGANGIAPGIKLGQEGVMDGDLPVAMTGRVYVKCSAENGAILPGDRLTTAHLSGHAMKATDTMHSDGAVIGKAMSSLDEGTGMVLVLVNLQ